MSIYQSRAAVASAAVVAMTVLVVMILNESSNLLNVFARIVVAGNEKVDGKLGNV